jgi:hypothetical protein
MSSQNEKKALFVSPCYCRSSWCSHCRTYVFTSRVHPIVKELRDFYKQIRHVTYTYNRKNYPEFKETGFTPELYDRVDRDFINGQKKLIKYLGSRLLGYVVFVEFQSDEFVHYHVIYLMKESGIKSMIGQELLHKYCDGEFINRITEKPIDSYYHFDNELGYLGKTGYFGNKNDKKKHQVKLPELILDSRRSVRAYRISNSLKKFLESVEKYNKSHHAENEKEKDELTEDTGEKEKRETWKRTNRERIESCAASFIILWGDMENEKIVDSSYVEYPLDRGFLKYLKSKLKYIPKCGLHVCDGINNQDALYKLESMRLEYAKGMKERKGGICETSEKLYTMEIGWEQRIKEKFPDSRQVAKSRKAELLKKKFEDFKKMMGPADPVIQHERISKAEIINTFDGEIIPF